MRHLASWAVKTTVQYRYYTIIS